MKVSMRRQRDPYTGQIVVYGRVRTDEADWRKRKSYGMGYRLDPELCHDILTSFGRSALKRLHSAVRTLIRWHMEDDDPSEPPAHGYLLRLPVETAGGMHIEDFTLSPDDDNDFTHFITTGDLRGRCLALFNHVDHPVPLADAAEPTEPRTKLP